MNSLLFRSALLLASCGYIIAAHAEEKAFKLKQTIPLPGVEGRIDHFALDPSGERLLVCALGNNTVEVIDLRKGERIQSITGLGAPQGIVYIPELDRLFVANDKGGILKIYDGKSFQEIGELNFKDDADNVRYDDATKKVYVGFGSGGIAIVNAPDGKQVGSIKLSAHPEAFEVEKNGRRIFVNVPNSRHVAVVDRDKGQVTAKWQTDLAFGNFPMAIDEVNRRLLSGAVLLPSLSCSTPNRATLLQRSTSLATRTTSSTTASAIAFTRSAALARSISSSRLMQTPIKRQLRSTQQTALVRVFSFRNATFCS